MNRILSHSNASVYSYDLSSYRTLFELLPYPVLEIDLTGTIVFSNKAFCILLEFENEPLTGKKIWNFLSTEDEKIFLKEYLTFISNNPLPPVPFTEEYLTNNNNLLYCKAYWNYIKDTSDNIHGYIAFFTQIDKIKTLELQSDPLLIESEKEKKQLQKNIIKLSDNIKKSLGHQLHDDLGQGLSAISFRIEALLKNIKSKSYSPKPDLNSINEIINDTIHKAKYLCKNLTSPDIYEKGLNNTLKKMAADTEFYFKINCKFFNHCTIKIDDLSVLTHFYYIARESIHNAVKHGKSKNIKMILSNNKKSICLEITDDGTGFANKMKLSQAEGMGLKIMKYRAGLCGSKISFCSKQNGVSVKIIKNLQYI